jgi:hypothetical protein
MVSSREGIEETLKFVCKEEERNAADLNLLLPLFLLACTLLSHG